MSLVTVFKRAPRTTADIRDGIESLSDFPGVTGTFRFSPQDHAGLSLDAFQVYQMRNGTFTALSLGR
jgi:branched-chain amino acid transport system substrate-binding protein